MGASCETLYAGICDGSEVHSQDEDELNMISMPRIKRKRPKNRNMNSTNIIRTKPEKKVLISNNDDIDTNQMHRKDQNAINQSDAFSDIKHEYKSDNSPNTSSILQILDSNMLT